MSFDQYVIAVLGHLAWRTPFAEDMQPWELWGAARLLAIGRSTAPRLKEPWRSEEHGDLLYDEAGIPA